MLRKLNGSFEQNRVEKGGFVRGMFYLVLYGIKVARFAWMAGWGAWLLVLTFVVFTGGSLEVPVVGGFLNFAYGNPIFGFLMIIFGIPIGLTLAHFSALILSFPGALLLTWISNRKGFEDLQRFSR
jgi:hypothetical protein